MRNLSYCRALTSIEAIQRVTRQFENNIPTPRSNQLTNPVASFGFVCPHLASCLFLLREEKEQYPGLKIFTVFADFPSQILANPSRIFLVYVITLNSLDFIVIMVVEIRGGYEFIFPA